MDDSTARRPPPDGGWGWVIAGVAFIINGIILGIHNSFGLFLDYFIENHVFGVTEKDTAAIGKSGVITGTTSGVIRLQSSCTVHVIYILHAYGLTACS